MTTNENKCVSILSLRSGIYLFEMTTTENAVFYWYVPDIGIDLLEMKPIENVMSSEISDTKWYWHALNDNHRKLRE